MHFRISQNFAFPSRYDVPPPFSKKRLMDHQPGRRIAAPSSSASLFAREVLADSTSGPPSRLAEAVASRVHLESLVADLSRENEHLEFVARILSIDEEWDPSKHPRGGFPENRGWFSPTWGSAIAALSIARLGAWLTGQGESAPLRDAEKGTTSVIRDSNRDQYIKTEKAELDAAVASKRITQAEATIRLAILKAVFSGQIVEEDNEKAGVRDPSSWQTDEATGKPAFKQGASASAIIDSAYGAKANDRIGYWCKRAAQFQILRGQTQAADRKGRAAFDRVADGKTPGSLFPEYDQDPDNDGKHKGIFTEVERSPNVGIDPKTLLPGDQTWVKNAKGSGTEAGSNKFYIGGGQFADPYSVDPGNGLQRILAAR
jgi:hypothetical protein